MPRKSSFGAEGNKNLPFIIIGLVLIAVAVYFLTKKKTPGSPSTPTMTTAMMTTPMMTSVPVMTTPGMTTMMMTTTPMPTTTTPMPTTTPAPTLKYVMIEKNSRQLYASPTLTNTASNWTLLPGTMSFADVIQLADGTFAALDYHGWVFTAETLSNNTTDWTQLLPTTIALQNISQCTDGTFIGAGYGNEILISPVLSGAGGQYGWSPVQSTTNNPIGLRAVQQMKNGTYVAIEYYSQQLYTSSAAVNDKDKWSQSTGTFGPVKSIYQLPNKKYIAADTNGNMFVSSFVTNDASAWAQIPGSQSIQGSKVIGFY
jgi:hypothetical protein